MLPVGVAINRLKGYQDRERLPVTLDYGEEDVIDEDFYLRHVFIFAHDGDLVEYLKLHVVFNSLFLRCRTIIIFKGRQGLLFERDSESNAEVDANLVKGCILNYSRIEHFLVLSRVEIR